MMDDAAKRAVRCALEMQRAMGGINDYNLERGWPEIEMGIALHTGEVVVGNIGSTRRSKYAVVGQTVNLTARIESFTVGGQVLVSPGLIRAANPGLVLGDSIEVHAKGMSEALQCSELVGHDDYPELMLDQRENSCELLADPQPLHYVLLSDKHLSEQFQPATLVGLSGRRGLLDTRGLLQPYDNIMLRWSSVGGGSRVLSFYAKVIRTIDISQHRYLVHFTSIPSEVQTCLRQLSKTFDQHCA
jgi:hypothetical protein